MGGGKKVVLFSLTHAVLILTWFVNFMCIMLYYINCYACSKHSFYHTGQLYSLRTTFLEMKGL